jgi:hypothetical protein
VVEDFQDLCPGCLDLDLEKCQRFVVQCLAPEALLNVFRGLVDHILVNSRWEALRLMKVSVWAKGMPILQRKTTQHRMKRDGNRQMGLAMLNLGRMSLADTWITSNQETLLLLQRGMVVHLLERLQLLSFFLSESTSLSRRQLKNLCRRSLLISSQRLYHRLLTKFRVFSQCLLAKTVSCLTMQRVLMMPILVNHILKPQSSLQ